MVQNIIKVEKWIKNSGLQKIKWKETGIRYKQYETFLVGVTKEDNLGLILW